MNRSSMYERMAKEPRINLSKSITAFIQSPVISDWHVDFEDPCQAMPGQIDINVIEPEVINYDVVLDEFDHGVDTLNYSMYALRRNMEKEMRLLEAGGIPVFVNDNTEPQVCNDFGRVSIYGCYQIPKELMYKSFYVRYGITEGNEKAGDYAMLKVMEVIDRY